MTIDLTTSWLGLSLPHPVVASASPFGHTLDGIRQLADGGAAAVVLASLFEEQILQEQAALEHLSLIGSHSYPEAAGYFPDSAALHPGPRAYLRLIQQARQVLQVPLIASLNGSTPSGWTDYARQLADAGADALELNIFWLPVESQQTGREVEQRYVDIVHRVTQAVQIPVSVKLSPYFSALGDIAHRLLDAGAAGLVLFNRFYQPDFDLDSMTVVPNLQLSSPAEIRLPLLWLGVLHGRVTGSLAASTGVESATEVIKYLAAGADVVMSTSALLRHGPHHLQTLVDGLQQWMQSRGYAAVTQLRGCMSQRQARHPEAYVRANYMRMLASYEHPFVQG